MHSLPAKDANFRSTFWSVRKILAALRGLGGHDEFSDDVRHCRSLRGNRVDRRGIHGEKDMADGIAPMSHMGSVDAVRARRNRE